MKITKNILAHFLMVAEAKRKIRTHATIVLILVLMVGCSKSDPAPTVVSKKDGQVVFWTNVDDKIGSIEVTLNGIKQTITKVTSVLGPACGQSGFATFQNPDGNYSFIAQELTAPSRKWSGNASFIANQCTQFRLNP